MAASVKRPALALALAGLLAMAWAAASALKSVSAYLDSPIAISSTSGNYVFTVDGALVSYAPFELGFEPVVFGAGLVVALAGLLFAAATWRQGESSLSRASTAGSNADAHTR